MFCINIDYYYCKANLFYVFLTTSGRCIDYDFSNLYYPIPNFFYYTEIHL